MGLSVEKMYFHDRIRLAGGLARRGWRHDTPLPSTRRASPPAKRLSLIVFSGFMLFAAGCNHTPENHPADGRLPVFVGIPPLAYLIEQIGREHVAVEVLVQPGQDPHTFQPTPRQVLALSKAAIFFKIGMAFEGVLVEKAGEGNRRMMVVDVAQGVPKRSLDDSEEKHVAGHNHDGEADDLCRDPHTWLSPMLLKIEAKNVANALCQADAAHEKDYRRNLAEFLERIDATHRRIERMLAPYRGRSVYVFHPSFGYFADAYGLKEEAIQLGGQSPSARQRRDLSKKARSEGVKTIFVQPQFSPQSAEVVAGEIGAKVVQIDDLAKDVLGNLEEVAGKIEKAMAESSPRSH
jgi:zinc transport system substrate-binding protein